MTVVVVCPSRKRPDSCRRTVMTMPVDVVSVAASEVPAYERVLASVPDALRPAVLSHPDEIVGGGQVYRWLLEQSEADWVVYCDDDITAVSCLVGKRVRRITDRDAIRRIIEETATVATGMGARLFSYAINANILNFIPYDPFNLGKGGGPVKGVSGRDGGFDPSLTYHIDGDIALTCLFRDRVVLKDTRFCFDSHVHTNMGGSQDLFSTAAWKRDTRYIAEKWGGESPRTWHLKHTGHKGIQGFPIVKMITTVRRRQRLECEQRNGQPEGDGDRLHGRLQLHGTVAARPAAAARPAVGFACGCAPKRAADLLVGGSAAAVHRKARTGLRHNRRRVVVV